MSKNKSDGDRFYIQVLMVVTGVGAFATGLIVGWLL